MEMISKGKNTRFETTEMWLVEQMSEKEKVRPPPPAVELEVR